MIRFPCAKCGKILKTPDRAFGRRGSCPRCGKRVIVPDGDQSPGVEIEAGDSQPSLSFDLEPEYSFDNKSTRRRNSLIAAIVLVSLTILTGICVWIYSANHAPENQPTPNTPIRVRMPGSAEEERPGSSSDNAKALTLGGLALVIVGGTCLSALAYLFFVVRMMAWVAKDAYARGMEGALWAIIFAMPHLWLLTPWLAIFLFYLLTVQVAAVLAWVFILLFVAPSCWIGLLVYFASRRPGILVKCERCFNSRLTYVVRCPACGVRAPEFDSK